MKTKLVLYLLVFIALITISSCSEIKSNSIVHADSLSAQITKERAMNYENALLGGGCFWCLEAVFEHLPGVIDVVNGYAGGNRDNPTYEEVCTGLTGHAEVVKITFDPAIVSYEKLLELFWKIHNPTTLNRQGADVGTQYRSVIFYYTDEQKRIAEASIAHEQTNYDDPIVTELLPAPTFWQAEDYHQDYFRNHPENAYCQIVIAPKIKKSGL
ncbi:MAG TPA: peptide-methionine (S)-S-oxide reductase MsrA [Spirochaetales bacterium]|nr:peptide-methionine (S)-S-oxide reductase MsrA [Spirochaetales bacterium]HQK35061.1 peptide-methionine (S)-S-oxide reductase MsrA [Spirochaetales bacterium]